jgi:hypothetical protein
MSDWTQWNFDFEDSDMISSKRRPGIIERVDMRMNLDNQVPQKELDNPAPQKVSQKSSIHNLVRRKGFIERVDEAMKLEETKMAENSK